LSGALCSFFVYSKTLIANPQNQNAPPAIRTPFPKNLKVAKAFQRPMPLRHNIEDRNFLRDREAA
jgi:hypothetical protein